MDLVINTDRFTSTGIFGTVEDVDGNKLFDCLEHAYDDGQGNFSPKLPNGHYICVRGTHQLKHGPPFETFEVVNVPGHTGILFHPGNVNADSDGCILLGMSAGQFEIFSSREAFTKFMDLQKNTNTFKLTVI